MIAHIIRSPLAILLATVQWGLPTPVVGQMAPSQSVPARAPTIERVDLGNGIYLFRAPAEIDMWTFTNSVVIINDADVIVFDSNTRPSTAAMVIAEIRKLTSKPVRSVINSHWHMDHWLGNEAYERAFPGVRFIATNETREFMRRMPIPFFVNMIGVARRVARLDTMVRTGVKPDGTPFTSEDRSRYEAALDSQRTFAAEIAGAKQVLPNVVYDSSLTFWSGGREFRLFSATGDASGSTVLSLPRERIVITGDVFVRPRSGVGAPPWTTNSYKIMPWLESLRTIAALEPLVIVPGQGPELRDLKMFSLTIALYESLIAQVHAALERGLLTLADVQKAVNLDQIRLQFTNGNPTLDANFRGTVEALIRKVIQEARDGIAGSPNEE